MIVLVTGGAGFIGSNFLNLFVPEKSEHRFVNLDKLTYAGRLQSLEAIATLPNYQFEQADIADAEAVTRLFERHRPDAVVHFAAESHVDRSIVGPREFVRTNVEGTFNLLEACRSHWTSGAGLFLHVSTDEVYGSLDDGAFVENTRYDPSSPYSASKAASDHLVRAYGRTYGLPVRITTASNNYGPRQSPEKLIPLMIANALDRQPLPVYGDGKNVRDWLYVEDCCRAIWTVIERGRTFETYNVGGGAERQNIDVVRALCQLVAEQTDAPESDLLALITLVEDRPGHDRRYALDTSKIRSECGFAPSETFETGLRKTVRWYLDNPRWVEAARTSEHQRWLAQNYGAR